MTLPSSVASWSLQTSPPRTSTSAGVSWLLRLLAILSRWLNLNGITSLGSIQVVFDLSLETSTWEVFNLCLRRRCLHTLYSLADTKEQEGHSKSFTTGKCLLSQCRWKDEKLWYSKAWSQFVTGQQVGESGQKGLSA